MKSYELYGNAPTGIPYEELFNTIRDGLAADQGRIKKLLIIPPDFTRYHSFAGQITNCIYNFMKDSCHIDILPALGTHVAMNEEECKEMFGDIPFDKFIVHNWRNDVVKIGTVDGSYVGSVSEGLVTDPIDVEVNKLILDPSYDLILSIGQVVPHEVVGMANRNKNIFVGCGGSSMINTSHMLGAFYGMERIMGKDFSPVRKVFDYAETQYIPHIRLSYILTVNTVVDGQIAVHGLFAGRERSYFEKAVALSQQKNLTFVDKPFKKVVVNLDEKEFKSTWLGNKAVYRTRMAIADEGDLIILAPGADKFGEDPAIDALIREYGYCGRINVLQLCKDHEDLRGNLSAAVHLIHGSSDDRFRITYCTRHLTQEEVTGVHFNYVPYDEIIKKYNPDTLVDGYNTLPDGEEIYYISNPALGLWADKAKF